MSVIPFPAPVTVTAELEGFVPSPVGAASLCSKALPSLEWLVEGLIPEGLTILAGRPKKGKSWAALNLTLGGEFLGRQVTEGGSLYIALEDNERRLQSRTKILAKAGLPVTDRAQFQVDWPSWEQDGVRHIDAYLNAHPSTKLVVVDTLGRFRGSQGSDAGYAGDVLALDGLHRLASGHRVSILVVHHLRKMGAADPLDTVSGTLGLSGTADTIAVIDDTRKYLRWVSVGRDLENPVNLPIKLENGLWVVSGDPEELADTGRPVTLQQQIIDWLTEQPPREEGFTIDEIRNGACPNTEKASVNSLLSKMAKDYQLIKPSRAHYDIHSALRSALPE